MKEFLSEVSMYAKKRERELASHRLIFLHERVMQVHMRGLDACAAGVRLVESIETRTDR